jgi:hypothetical protein
MNLGLLHLLVIVVVSFSSDVSEVHSGAVIAPRAGVEYKLSRPSPVGAHNVIFLHALVGVFPRRRGNGSWGHGREILIELLDTINSSGLVDKVDSIRISLLGKPKDRADTMTSLLPYKKVSVLVESSNTQLAEFPALHLLQSYASKADPRTRILYMHTKGVRKNGLHNYPDEWRRYMSFFLVEKSHVCLNLLERDPNYATCGVLKQHSIYQGNFWWSTASWIASRTPKIWNFRWNMQNRYIAEEYLMRPEYLPHGSHFKKRSHYCIHHAHHTMQVCHTPREWYENVSVAIRDSSNCFNRQKLPKNPTRNPHSWCHHGGLPRLDS